MERVSKTTKEYDILKQLRKRFTREFLDLIILARLCSINYVTGYSLIGYIQQKFKTFLSSGTIYSTLYALERKGLIRGESDERRRIYCITPKGEKIIQTVDERIDSIKSLFSQLELGKKYEQETAVL